MWLPTNHINADNTYVRLESEWMIQGLFLLLCEVDGWEWSWLDWDWESEVNVVEPNVALQFWVVMGNSLIQKEVIKMEQFAGEFWALLQMTSFHSESHQDVNDPQSHHTLFILMTSYCHNVSAACFCFLQLSYNCLPHWMVGEILCSNIKSAFFCHILHELAGQIHSNWLSCKPHFCLTPISFLP